jgi:hypothetical protein
MPQVHINSNLMTENVLLLTYDICFDVENELAKYPHAPTREQLIDIISEVQVKHTYDVELTNSILFFVLGHKLSEFSTTHQDSKDMHDLLLKTLIKELHVKNLSSAYTSLIKSMEIAHKLISPLYVGKQSEAKQKADARRLQRDETMNAWIMQGDEKIQNDMTMYSAFIEAIAEGQPLTDVSFNRFRQSLQDEMTHNPRVKNEAFKIYDIMHRYCYTFKIALFILSAIILIGSGFNTS